MVSTRTVGVMKRALVSVSEDGWMEGEKKGQGWGKHLSRMKVLG